MLPISHVTSRAAGEKLSPHSLLSRLLSQGVAGVADFRSTVRRGQIPFSLDSKIRKECVRIPRQEFLDNSVIFLPEDISRVFSF